MTVELEAPEPVQGALPLDPAGEAPPSDIHHPPTDNFWICPNCPCLFVIRVRADPPLGCREENPAEDYEFVDQVVLHLLTKVQYATQIPKQQSSVMTGSCYNILYLW